MEIKDYLHLYIGCELSNGFTLNHDMFSDGYLKAFEYGNVKPILRPLSDMTEEEKGYLMEVANLEPEDLDILNGGTAHLTTLKDWVAATNYLRKNGFDIDGLIEAGIAIDKTTLTPHKKTG